MRGPAEHTAAAAAAEADKDKKKRRRQNRRPKQTLAGLPGEGSGSMDSGGGQLLPEWSENWRGGGSGVGGGLNVGLQKASNVGFSSLPAMHMNGVGDDGGMPAGLVPYSVAGGEISQSCPFPNSSSALEAPVDPAATRSTAKKYFSPYWSEQAVEEAIEKGNAFKATFRVNAHNNLEAYCTIDGVPVDVLINGVAAQNRAIEGDVVVVMLDPLASWARLKGSNLSSNPVLADDPNMLSETQAKKCARKEQLDANCACQTYSNDLLPLDRRCQFDDNGSMSEVAHSNPGNGPETSDKNCIVQLSDAPTNSNVQAFEQAEPARTLERICAMINSYPSKRPTGRVLSIIRMSPRRGAVIGFLSSKKWLPEGEGYGNMVGCQVSTENKIHVSLTDEDYIQLISTDPKFPKMLIAVSSLADSVKERLKNGDMSVEKELVVAQIDEWSEESLFPQACIVLVLGRGGEIEPQIGAILFENAICAAKFSPESVACLLDVPWRVPVGEFECRLDLRNICTFTIDPSSATDLDDALSVEIISDEVFRVGVHIADVSYFVLPDTALDTEAQIRSTSVYILQHKLPMLPPKFSEEVGSLVPGADRLAFSIIWDIDHFGNIKDRWIGRSIIQSSCKLSYEFVQDIIDGSFDVDRLIPSESSGPQLHGQFKWKDVFESLRGLHEISKKLRDIRFKDGALWLETAKLVFLFDECGTPYDSFLSERKDSCSLVEEFMLLANRSVAEVISKAFPDCALLRRHPEPNLRKLKEFEAFCSKHGFELDTASSGQLHLSLSKIREKLKNDRVLFDILISYASRPMQPAAYFCTGDLKGRENDWAHYALSVPFYTHFTSPLRRYPDIIVHRTLSAVLDAEDNYSKKKRNLLGACKGEASGSEIASRCFTGLYFDKDAAESEEGSQILSAAALKFKVPGTEVLAEVAAYCNERKLASKHAEEAGERVYLWALLKKKEVLVSEARVLGLGPRFMSVYIHKLAIERRIYYDEVEGLTVEWFETTCTLVLDILRNKRIRRRGSPRKFRAIEEVALVLNPSELVMPEKEKKATEVGCGTASLTSLGLAENSEIYPAVFPLVLQHLSAVPVALHAVGGDDGPLDIGVRLYMCSYFW